jgi:hypothetical protein
MDVMVAPETTQETHISISGVSKTFQTRTGTVQAT